MGLWSYVGYFLKKKIREQKFENAPLFFGVKSTGM
jgi:hypothetical protein